ncbi:putative seryl-tRNA synthetase [Coccomyxa subellipsoidea C-169]|uniref:serine--tRNA ligase n=1 Tax=Coccomyxa subellipsoidea (strain C-169) TaxID=574566 RepID=I0YNQ3_COCSC|nr:putative seryl-tRNA synthetase [Coccomyxa subellipsoidea C-169]EIE20022.1 putative seryl-tRNA synthetase [Coccomyxa subellipsoidea C-169]|eukprot:XP_005644566.1 putative seryl-tRNA synthetase [Coccomyxa subellipsoidea C-169]
MDATASSSNCPSETVELNRPAFRAYLDFRFVKSNLDKLRENVKNRNSSADPDLVARLYDNWVRVLEELESVRADRNSNARAMKGKLDPEKRSELVDQGKALKARLAVLEAEVEMVEDALQREGQKLPNISHPDVPVGGEEAARVIKMVGSRRNLGLEVKDHMAVGTALDLIDFETGANVSGAKFVYLRRAAALLELALCNYAMQKVASKGFLPMTTPDLVRESVLIKCGFQPRGDNTQVYSIRDTGLCLTGTAEVPLAAVYMDQIIPEEQLPIRLAAFGHCFRTEAGSAGSASRGLYRVHQFSKVEMFVLSTPEQSEAMLQELCDIEEEIFTELGLHFQMLDMPTGDLGAPAYRKIDIEAWMPGLQRYGEVSSASNCTDYQARRLNIRYRPSVADEERKGGSKKTRKLPTEFLHTLNATACAVPRLIVAILENCQAEDGSVVIPQVLRPYMGGMECIQAPDLVL